MVPKSIDCCPREKREEHTETQRSGHIMTLETGVMCLQAEEHQGLLAATSIWDRDKEETVSEPQEGPYLWIP